MTEISRRGFFRLASAAGVVSMVEPRALLGAAASFVEDAAGAWVPCDGRTLSREGYPELFAAIGRWYGAEDGESFKLPVYRVKPPAPSADASRPVADLDLMIKVRPPGADDLPAGTILWWVKTRGEGE